MIKKILILLLTLLPLGAVAQQPVGSWYFYPVYGGVPSRVVDTPSLTYFLSQGRLYSYDKANDETRDYVEKLSDTGISVIDYYPASKLLFIGYENGNVDLLYDGGKVVNLPDIREASLSYEKRVNQVDFSGRLIYVATAFGLVVFDAQNGTVKQSGVYGKNVSAVAAQGEYIIICADNRAYGIHRDKILSRFDNFTRLDELYNMEEMKGVDDYVLVRTSGMVRPLRFDVPQGRSDIVGKQLGGKPAPLMRGTDGKMRVITDGKVYAYGRGGECVEEAAVPSILADNAFGIWDGPASTWAANADGLGCYDITTATPTVKTDRILPADAVAMANVAYIRGSADGETIYLSTVTESIVNRAIDTRSNPSTICALTPGGIVDVSPREGLTTAAGGTATKINYQSNFAVDPTDDGRLLVPTQTQGLYVVKDGRQVAQFTDKNSSLQQYVNAVRCYGAEVDPYGNLWVVTLTGTDASAADYGRSINILPASRFNGDLVSVTAAGWGAPKVENFRGHSDVRIVFIPDTHMAYLSNSNWGGPLVCYDTNGTPANTADDRHSVITRFIDQDGKTFDAPYRTDMVVDNTGVVWVGTGSGVYTIPDPAAGLTAEFRISRPKVPRNDGTNFADYLLDGEWITAIAVDGSNNKWIGTDTSGLYYVNADGSEILAHFTTSNSPLPTNTISALYCDPGSNEIYVGSRFGLMRYSGFHSPGSPDYSEVVAYPNPVKPGYTGWITVKGLMDNSLVKIVDASGAVVYQGRSDGGMFTWDGCNSNGRRVKSGVYYVFASSNNGDSAAAAVTKILILN